ncbi:hypothetical protein FFLO_00832 [Filobasidium floriforme]|uniref:Ribosomal protein/NADH dehydrogenase domain-containing protein n=1 Tax=Filobasidium floriforme TaxID=5210 RepID=A0A8K0JRL6_9TREE|nr:thioredoxin-like protein [Filobasidium floriforme]KAG7571159.1 hypothetical protein FFLO_00832 [Filobasidium floriforme]KAH8086996.1 thioredoxin-like protein [Filobasidium floriforme]
MSFIKQIPKSLKELRVHMCQTSPSSQGLRQFVLSNYPALKSSNPDLKVLIREARGVEPRVFARFEHGRETQTSFADMSESEVSERLSNLVKS